VIRTQISMTEDQAEGLRRLSALRQKSQSALLREALDRLLADEERERRVAAARAAVGRFTDDTGDGRSDVSEDHDAALDDIWGS